MSHLVKIYTLFLHSYTRISDYLLHSLLHPNRPKSDVRQLQNQLLRFCQEIADAMEYLSKKGFIHRDLAARNILLTADTKCKVCHIYVCQVTFPLCAFIHRRCMCMCTFKSHAIQVNIMYKYVYTCIHTIPWSHVCM